MYNIYEKIGEVLNNKLDKYIQEFYDKNNNIEYEPLYTMEDVDKLSPSDVQKIVGKIDIEEIRRKIVEKVKKQIIRKGVKEYKKFTQYENAEQMIRTELNKQFASILNKKVEEDNDKIKLIINSNRTNAGKLKDVKVLIQKENIDIEKAITLISETNLSDENKEELITYLNNYAMYVNKKYEEKIKEKEEKENLEKSKKETEIKQEELPLEKLFDIKNYEEIRNIIDKYEIIFPNKIMNSEIKEYFDMHDLVEVTTRYNYFDLDDDLFSESFLTLLSKIDKSSNKDDINVYKNILEKLCIKFELLISVNTISEQLKNLYSMSKLSEDNNQRLFIMQRSINEITTNKKYTDIEVQNVLNNIEENIRKVKSDLLKNELNDDKLAIKSFILFDYYLDDDKIKKTYILTDLDDKNNKTMIDNSLDRSKIKINGYDDFNELIDDLIINGDPSILKDKNDKLNKLIKPVYYTQNAHQIIKSKMDNATGMYRIRPTLTSFVRFIDEKIQIDNNSSNFEIIVNILESKLENVQINRNEPFILYINYLDAFKASDTEAYRISIKRQEKSKLRELLKKDKLDENDLKELTDIIDKTIDSFKKLKEINSNFDFKTIDKITNTNTYTP